MADLTRAEYLPDGVYLELAEEPYFAQDALGSSDLVKLHRHRHGWWWQSRHNPDRKPRSTKDLIFGQALHAVMLEGIAAYEARFAVTPVPPPGAISTARAAKAALQGAGFNTAGTSSWKTEDWFWAMRQNLPQVPCWPNIEADWHDSLKPGMRVLSAVEDRMLRIMFDAAMEDPEINGLLGSAPDAWAPLAEVSVLLTLADGTRRRWRFDRLFPSFTMDLKSLGNWEGRPLNFAVGDHIGRNGYDVQRADYDFGRLVLNRFVLDGFQVYGGSPEQRRSLLRLCQLTENPANPKPDWVWLFYQKPDPLGRAPVVFPVYDDGPFWEPNIEAWQLSDLHRWGMAKAQAAFSFYLEAKARFGLDRPWTLVEPLHYTVEGRGPTVVLPHWIADETPTDPGAYPTEPQPIDL